MTTYQESIELDVPVTTAYNQWTQFEEFPRFMEGVELVQQLDDTHLRWVADVAGERKEWVAEIVEQVPDKAIQWRAQEGDDNAGAVLFDALGDGRSRVTLRLSFEPEGLKEKVGDVLGVPERVVKQDLENFRQYIEQRGTETGAWRGEVHEGDVEGGSMGLGGARQATPGVGTDAIDGVNL